MPLFRRQAYIVALLVLFALFVRIDAAQSLSSTVHAPTATNHSESPQPPVSYVVLQAYLKAAGTLDSNPITTQVQLEARRKTLPVWFPQAVWDEVEKKVLAIDLTDVYLPVYRKYLTNDTLQALTLLFQGPTGEQIARISAKRMTAAMQSGSAGYAADMQGADSMASHGEDALYTKRMKELSPEDQDRLAKATQALNPVLQALDNEQSAAFSQRTNEIWKAVVKTHSTEIAAAQNSALHPGPAK